MMNCQMMSMASIHKRTRRSLQPQPMSGQEKENKVLIRRLRRWTQIEKKVIV